MIESGCDEDYAPNEEASGCESFTDTVGDFGIVGSWIWRSGTQVG